MKIKTLTLGPLGTNCYIIESGKEKAVIDPGFWSDELINVKDNIKYILLTHCHVDHIMGVHELKKRTNAMICAHEKEIDSLCDTKKSLYDMMDCYSEPQKSDKIDMIIRDGDNLTLGNETIKILHTPGHTSGSICFLTDENLFSGDTLFFENIGRTDFLDGDFCEMKSSLKKLYDIDGDRKVFPGHDGETTLEHERKFNPYMDFRL